MKVMSGGWIWDIPEETAFLEIVDGGDDHDVRVRCGLTLWNAEGTRIDTPSADLVPEPEPWIRRVA